MWYAILASFAVMLLLFFTSTPGESVGQINEFALATGGRPTSSRRRGGGRHGGELNPPFWLFGTLMVAPIAWTCLQGDPSVSRAARSRTPTCSATSCSS
jgi:hypothetical protein